MWRELALTVEIGRAGQVLNGGKVADATQTARTFSNVSHDLSGASMLKPEYTVRSLDQLVHGEVECYEAAEDRMKVRH